MFTQQILCNLLLPLITIAKQLFLIVQKLLVSFGGEFKVRSFDDGINGACLLTLFIFVLVGGFGWESVTNKRTIDKTTLRTYKTAINTLGHINVISRSPPSPILPLLRIDSNSLRRTSRFTQLTRNTTFVTTRITTQGVFSSEAGGEVAFFVGVVDGYFGFEGDFSGEPKGSPYFGHEKYFGGAFEDVVPGGLVCVVLDGGWGGELMGCRVNNSWCMQRGLWEPPEAPQDQDKNASTLQYQTLHSPPPFSNQ